MNRKKNDSIDKVVFNRNRISSRYKSKMIPRKHPNLDDEIDSLLQSINSNPDVLKLTRDEQQEFALKAFRSVRVSDKKMNEKL